MNGTIEKEMKVTVVGISKFHSKKKNKDYCSVTYLKEMKQDENNKGYESETVFILPQSFETISNLVNETVDILAEVTVNGNRAYSKVVEINNIVVN